MEGSTNNSKGTTVFSHTRSTLSRVSRRVRRRPAERVARSLPHRVAMRPAGDLGEQLRRLHDEYVWDVNSALEDGREDLVGDLSDAYADDALLVIARDPEAGR